MTDMTTVDDLVPRHDVPRGGRSGFVVIDGRQVHYLQWGRAGAGPVLCLHGGGQTAYMFEELGAHLRDRYHVVAPDLPSHGDSDDVGTDFGPSAIATTIAPLLADFGLERAAFVGASLGGMVSIHVGAEHPELMSSLTLIDVGHRLEPEGVRRIIDFMAAHESFASLEEAADQIADHLPERKAVRPESLSRNLRRREDGRWIWKHGFGRRFRARDADEPHPADDLDQFLSGVEERARRLRCPVLILRGAQSDVLSDDGAEAVAALIPDARLQTVENAGHLAVGDNPHSTVALIDAFLTELSR
ncbi:alpha/beta hydrolase [soil metagenome]